MGITITDRDTRAYYEAHREDFRNVVRTTHILLDTQEEALSVLAKLNAGENFYDLVDEYSLCPSKIIGGDQNYLPRHMAAPEYDEASVAIERPGDVVGPVKTEYGYHIIKLLGRRDELPYEEAEYTLRVMLRKWAEEECTTK